MASERAVRVPLAPGARPRLAPLAVAAAGAAGCLLVGLVDPARTPVFPPCPFKAMTGLDCPGCGTTRAMHQLVNGNLTAALGFNAVAVLAVPLVLWWWAAWALPLLGGPVVPRFAVPRRAWPWLIGGLALFAVARNLPVAPFAGLGT